MEIMDLSMSMSIIIYSTRRIIDVINENLTELNPKSSLAGERWGIIHTDLWLWQAFSTSYCLPEQNSQRRRVCRLMQGNSHFWSIYPDERMLLKHHSRWENYEVRRRHYSGTDTDAASAEHGELWGKKDVVGTWHQCPERQEAWPEWNVSSGEFGSGIHMGHEMVLSENDNWFSYYISINHRAEKAHGN